MKSDKNILIAFILNFCFSIFEFIGGSITNSISIISDSIHDMGDALSIAVSFFLEKISKKKPNDKYTYGYIRYSLIGSLITTIILILGSILVIYNSVIRIINPVNINYDGMIVFAVIGILVNFLAAYFTKDGESLNQKSVNLHMIEDVMNWIMVLIGAIIMRFTDIKIVDPILSILVALFILKNAVNNLKEVLNLFLEKTPNNISIKKLKEDILKIKNVNNVHHIHVWSIDGFNNYATMHVVCNKNIKDTKELIRKELKKYSIIHVTIEIEDINETCENEECVLETKERKHHHNH